MRNNTARCIFITDGREASKGIKQQVRAATAVPVTAVEGPVNHNQDAPAQAGNHHLSGHQILRRCTAYTPDWQRQQHSTWAD